MGWRRRLAMGGIALARPSKLVSIIQGRFRGCDVRTARLDDPSAMSCNSSLWQLQRGFFFFFFFSFCCCADHALETVDIASCWRIFIDARDFIYRNPEGRREFPDLRGGMSFTQSELKLTADRMLCV